MIEGMTLTRLHQVQADPLERLVKAVIARAFKDLRWRNPELREEAAVWLLDERTVEIGRALGLRWQMEDIEQAVAFEQGRAPYRMRQGVQQRRRQRIEH